MRLMKTIFFTQSTDSNANFSLKHSHRHRKRCLTRYLGQPSRRQGDTWNTITALLQYWEFLAINLVHFSIYFFFDVLPHNLIIFFLKILQVIRYNFIRYNFVAILNGFFKITFSIWCIKNFFIAENWFFFPPRLLMTCAMFVPTFQMETQLHSPSWAYSALKSIWIETLNTKFIAF